LVNAIVRILECSGDFEDDKMFMRRLAYVETRDGAEGQGTTGIWGFTEKHLGYMDVGVLVGSLSDLADQMCNKYGIYMRRALRKKEKLNLRDPLVSGVVARFYLHYVTVQEGLQIPSAEDVNGQAAFWASWFNRTATPQYFTNCVAELKGICPCSNMEGACPSLLQDDWMNRDNANGSEVVEAVLQRLNKSQIFPADHRFMRRVVHVETRNGTVTTATNTSRKLCHKAVGMWGITENMLHSMKVEIKSDVTKYRELITASEDICAEFGVNMTGPEKLNMRNPLVSGIAARFYFYYQVLLNNMALPNNELPEDLEGQAIFFKKSYKKTDINKFLKDVNDLEGCKVNVDIMFVLDISHSLKDDHLEQVFEFMTKFVKNLIIGPRNDRVGAVVFGDYAHVMLTMSEHDNKQKLLSAIERLENDAKNVRQSGEIQNTNTSHGLTETLAIFMSDSRQSNTVFRVALVLSDGVSDDPDSTVREAANLRNFSVLVYAIGVGSGINDEEMKAIATDCHRYTYLDHFDPEQFEAVRDSYFNDICLNATTDITGLLHFDGDLDLHEIMRYTRLVPHNGLTIRVCSIGGRVTISVFCYVPEDSGDILTFKPICDHRNDTMEASCPCLEVYIPGSIGSSEDPQQDERSRRRAKRATVTTEVHITVEGMETENLFVMDTTDGDDPNDCAGMAVASDCVTHFQSPKGRGEENPRSGSKGPSKKTVVIAATVSSTGFILICCIVIVSSVGGWVLYRRKKQQQQKKTEKEEEYKLLDNEYVEM
jgi:collagen type VI alpha